MTVSNRVPSRSPAPWLTIQEVARRSGFSEPTLRYYERIGLIDPVPRDDSSRHRRYPPPVVERIEALACLRATGMGIEELRTYRSNLAIGRESAADMVDLFERRAALLEEEMRAMKLRHAYVTAKAALWQARLDGDTDAEVRAAQTAQRLAHELQHPPRTDRTTVDRTPTDPTTADLTTTDQDASDD